MKHISRVLLVGVLVGAGCDAATDAATAERHELPSKPENVSVSLNIGRAGAEGAEGATSTSAVKLTGNTVARRQSAVAASGAGLLTKLLVREGDVVKKGQLLARLDARQATLMSAQAAAGLQAAKVQLKAAERERKRFENLAKDSAVSGAKLDAAITAHEGAQAAVEMANVQVNTAAKFLDDTRVRSPYAGLITARLKTEGEWISTMPPAPLLVLVELDPMEVRLEAPAHLMGQIALGTSLRLRFPAVGKEFVTKVTRIVPAIRAATRSFTVIAELPNPDHSLQPGLFTEAWMGSAPTADLANAAPALALPEPEPPAAPAAPGRNR